jgi:hypothetical protein
MLKGAMKLFRYEYIPQNTYWAHIKCIQFHEVIQYDGDIDDKTKIPLNNRVCFKTNFKTFKECYES